MNASRTSKLISTIQICVSSLLTAFIVIGLYQNWNGGIGTMLADIFPELAIILGTLIPVLVLRIKHRSQVAEGYLLPLFLLFLSLQPIRILPSLTSWAGGGFLSYSRITMLERFFFMSTYVVLLYAAILNMKSMNTVKTGTYVIFSLIAVFVISCIIPTPSSSDQYNKHELIFSLLVMMVLICAVSTYLVSFISDRESYHMKRFLTFLLLSAGDFLIVTLEGNLTGSIIGTCLFVIGAVMLSVVSPKGY